jgi:NIMA (never in mitosis gene a)-related kinase
MYNSVDASVWFLSEVLFVYIYIEYSSLYMYVGTIEMIVAIQVRVLAMLDHPNIISYYDSFEEDGVLMIEMEYADGG